MERESNRVTEDAYGRSGTKCGVATPFRLTLQSIATQNQSTPQIDYECHALMTCLWDVGR